MKWATAPKRWRVIRNPRPEIDCARLQKMAKDDSPKLIAAFGEIDEFVVIHDRVVNGIDAVLDQVKALSLLTESLCGDSE